MTSQAAQPTPASESSDGTRHVVHVGCHKTASTWLQRCVFPFAGGARFVSPEPLFRALLHNLVGQDPRPDVLRTALDGVDGRSLISFESLSGSPWRDGPSATECADRLHAAVAQAVIVIVRRDVEELADSLYRQYVNEGGHTSQRHFKDHVLRSGYLDLDGTIDAYRRRFEPVLVVEYRDLRTDPSGTLARLATSTGLDFSNFDLRRVNPSLHGWRLELLRRWNRLCRTSTWNPHPPLPIPGAVRIRRLLQATISDRQ